MAATGAAALPPHGRPEGLQCGPLQYICPVFGHDLARGLQVTVPASRPPAQTADPSRKRRFAGIGPVGKNGPNAHAAEAAGSLAYIGGASHRAGRRPFKTRPIRHAFGIEPTS